MRRARVLVVGLDGATFDLISPLVEAGKMPTLAGLIRTGGSGVLRSIVPPHTAAAWSTLITGKNPGQHGVSGFEQIALRDYGCRGDLTQSHMLAGQTIFDLLGGSGMRVGAVRIPMTYPAWQINGVMVSGYPSPNRTGGHTWPTSLSQDVPPMVAMPSSNDPGERLSVLLREISTCTDIAQHLLDSETFDLFMVVYQQPDQAHHFFWHFIDPASPCYSIAGAKTHGDAIARVYQQIDVELARLLAAAEPDMTLIVSDHGAARSPRQQFHVNAWLSTLGLLRLRNPQQTFGQRFYSHRSRMLSRARRIQLRRFLERILPQSIRSRMEEFILNVDQVDWSMTQVYRFPLPELTEGLAINLRGRQPQGIVEPGHEYDSLRTKLLEELRRLRTPNGDPLVAHVWLREELFSGDHASDWPDIVFRLHPDVQAGTACSGPLFSPVPMQAFERHSGTHDERGILVASGAGIKPGSAPDEARLLDFAPTVFRLLGADIPTSFEGRILTEMLTDGASMTTIQPARSASQREFVQPVAEPVAAAVLSAEDEQTIRDRLRDLGYL